MRLRIAIVSLLVLVLTASAQDFQIRTRVDLVVVPVTVKGSGDKLINGLQKEDFIVLEDGQRLRGGPANHRDESRLDEELRGRGRAHEKPENSADDLDEVHSAPERSRPEDDTCPCA